MSKAIYKTSRKYKCPYCELKMTRIDLINHVEKSHQELIPENYTAARAVFDSINHTDHGVCMICKKPIYVWNDKINRYYNICQDNKSCKAKVRENALARHMKVYNKPTLLNDAEHQEKMLANRRISGTYIWSDGKKFTYTGKYEKNALEFIDKVLEIPSDDIQAPGPVLEYEYNGETHKWITDIYYIPANLLIEIKDGGSNPNNRSMESYRDKQVAKETMVTNLGTYSYIRLTNNNFAQLLNIFADMKLEALNEEKPKPKFHINEEVGGLPPHRPPEAYIVPYGMNNVFSGFAYGDSEFDKILTIDDDGNILPLVESEFYDNFETGPVLYYKDLDINDRIRDIHNSIKSKDKRFNRNFFVEKLLQKSIMKPEDVLLSESFRYFDYKEQVEICSLIENANYENINITNYENSDFIDSIDYVSVHQSPFGYFATTPKDFFLVSNYYMSIEELERSGCIEFMNKVYANNFINTVRKENNYE